MVATTLLAYANSFSTPFVFDDLPAIVHNDTIRQLWPLSSVLSPPLDAAGAIGRPVVNLSFALNYAAGGLDVRGYHLLNLALHLGVGFLFFGVLRRTLLQPALRARFAGTAVPVAGVAALLWLVHPLLTESVTFVTQRNEILAGIFYLLTLYAFIRSLDATIPWRWQTVAIGSCLLGMASKELVVSAPLLVLLYDRTFVAGSFRAALRQRLALYAGLAATWLLLAYLVVGNAHRAGTVGFGLGVSSWHYLLTQCRAIVHYLVLAAWPHPLVLDYGTDIETRLAAVLPQAMLLVGLFGATVVSIWRRSAWGVVGAWFFVILAPSSSVLPLTTQTMAEHRMYLPLLAVIVPAIVGLHMLVGRRIVAVALILTLALGVMTRARNLDYRSVENLWMDTVAKRPGNPRAHLNLGNAARATNRIDAAIGHYETAVRLKPNYAEARYNLGSALLLAGRKDEGIARLQEALTLSPDYEDARLNLALALAKSGRPADAVPHFERMLPLRPLDAGLRYNLGNALLELGRTVDALGRYEEAVRIEPAHVPARYNLGNALLQAGRAAEAERRFEEVLRLQPDFADASFQLGSLRARTGRHEQAAADFAQVLQLKPGDLEARFFLALSCEALGRLTDARSHYERVLAVEPGFEPARQALARLRRSP